MMIIAFVAYFIISLPKGFCMAAMGSSRCLDGILFDLSAGLMPVCYCYDETPRTSPQNLMLNT